MQYLLFGILILLFFISYFGGGKDLFAPSTVQVITFVFASLMCAYLLTSIPTEYSLHAETVYIIVSNLAISVLIGIIVHQLFRKIRIKSLSFNSQSVTPIPPSYHYFVILFMIITIIWQLIEIRRIGGSNNSFFHMMNVFRSRNSYLAEETAQVPLLLKVFRHVGYTFFVIYGFNLIRFSDVLSVKQKITNVFVIMLCAVSGVLTAARSSTVMNVIACILIYHLLRIQKNGVYRTYRFKELFRIVMICLFILWLFSALRSFVGRESNMRALDYIANYTGAELINFDLYLQSPPAPSKIWGKYTFYQLISNLRMLRLVDIKPYIGHLEYRKLGRISLGNVYTLFRTYHYDFGLVGIYVLHGSASLFYSIFYEYTKRRRGNISILICGFAYYGIALSFFAERFFSNVFSIASIERIFLLIVFYKFFIQKGIRFGRKRLTS